MSHYILISTKGVERILQIPEELKTLPIGSPRAVSLSCELEILSAPLDAARQDKALLSSLQYKETLMTFFKLTSLRLSQGATIKLLGALLYVGLYDAAMNGHLMFLSLNEEPLSIGEYLEKVTDELI